MLVVTLLEVLIVIVVVSWHELIVEVIFIELVVIVQVHIRIVLVVVFWLALFLENLGLVLQLLHQLLAKLLFILVVDIELKVLAVSAPILLLLLLQVFVIWHLKLIAKFLLIKLFLIFFIFTIHFFAIVHFKLLIVGAVIRVTASTVLLLWARSHTWVIYIILMPVQLLLLSRVINQLGLIILAIFIKAALATIIVH
jgi:hypothetical protein